MPLRLSLAWRNSVSRKERSAFTLVAVGLGVGMILATGLTGASMHAELAREAQVLVGNADAEVYAFSQAGFSQQMVQTITGLPEVKVAAQVVEKRLNGILPDQACPTPGACTQSFEMIGIDPRVEPRLHALPLTAGRMLSDDDKASVLLDSGWAGSHKLGVGSRLVLFTSTGPDVYRVKGLLRDTSFTQGSYGPVVFVSLTAAQHAFRLGARVTQVSVELSSPACRVASTGACPDYAGFRQDLRSSAFEEYSVRDNHAFFSGQKDPFVEIQPVIAFFSLLTLVIGIFVIYNNLAVTVVERRRDIGLLRAAGATAGWVRGLFVTQAAILGIAGSVVGLVLGFLVAELLLLYIQGAAGKPGLSLVVDAGAIVAALAVGVGGSLVSALLPANRAATLAPLEALRPQDLGVREQGPRGATLLGVAALLTGVLVLMAAGTLLSSGGGASSLGLELGGVVVLLFFTGTLLLVPALISPLSGAVTRPVHALLPAESILARNSVVRRPNRTALTIAGLVVSVALVVAVAGLGQGAAAAGDRWVNSLFVSDWLLVSPVAQTDAIRQEVAKTDGVSATSPISFFTLRSSQRAVNMAAMDPLDYASRNRLEFVAGDRQAAFTQLEESRSVFIPQGLASARHLHLGDVMVLGSNSGDLKYRVAAVLSHGLPSPGGEETMLIASGNARQDFGVSGFNVLQVIPAGSAGSDFASRLNDVAQRFGMELESVNDVRAGVQHGISTLLLLLTGVALAGLVLGLISVVNTILLSISESAREFGLLRAVGATREQVRRVILAQATILGVCGAVVGCVLGLILTEVMILVSSSPGFQLGYSIPWQSIILAIVVSAAGSLLAVVIPARRGATASIIASVRYE